MEIDVLTLFPQIFTGALSESILGRALEKQLVQVNLLQIRDYTADKHRTVDDLPYGGGPGMVMKCEPLYAAWEAAKTRNPGLPARTILLSPQGAPLRQEKLEEWGRALPGNTRLILICGRYEGVDERFIEECVDEEVSLGDFVLTGGEIPALALIDGLVRLLPGVLGNQESTAGESFSSGRALLEYPHYTRPPEFHGQRVPDVLLSGDHAKIAKWREGQRLERTRQRRPDLLAHKNGELVVNPRSLW